MEQEYTLKAPEREPSDLEKALKRQTIAGIGKEPPLSIEEQRLIVEYNAKRVTNKETKTPQQLTQERRGRF